MKICKTYRFEAAHHLPGYDGPCSQPHGHSYILEVEVSGPVVSRPGKSDDQMVLDFADLDAVVKPLVKLLDHTYLNDSATELGVTRTTAEALVAGLVDHIAHGLALRLAEASPNGCLRLSRVRLWETAKALAEWERGD